MPRKPLKGEAVLLRSRAKPRELYRVNRPGECRRRAASSTRIAHQQSERSDLDRVSGRRTGQTPRDKLKAIPASHFKNNESSIF